MVSVSWESTKATIVGVCSDILMRVREQMLPSKGSNVPHDGWQRGDAVGIPCCPQGSVGEEIREQESGHGELAQPCQQLLRFAPQFLDTASCLLGAKRL